MAICAVSNPEMVKYLGDWDVSFITTPSRAKGRYKFEGKGLVGQIREVEVYTLATLLYLLAHSFTTCCLIYANIFFLFSIEFSPLFSSHTHIRSNGSGGKV